MPWDQKERHDLHPLLISFSCQHPEYKERISEGEHLVVELESSALLSRDNLSCVNETKNSRMAVWNIMDNPEEYLFIYLNPYAVVWGGLSTTRPELAVIALTVSINYMRNTG